MKQRGYKRRTLLVGRLQYRLLAVTIAHFVVFAALVAVALFAPLIVQLESTTLDPQRQGQAAAQFLYLDHHFWPALVVIFAFLAFHSVIVSHRIAGPLVKIRRVLRAVGDGDLTVSAVIRRHDYLQEDAEAVNQMIAGLSARMEQLCERCGEVAAAWAGLRAGLEPEGASARPHIERLGAKIVGLEVALEGFKIGKSTPGGAGGEQTSSQ